VETYWIAAVAGDSIRYAAADVAADVAVVDLFVETWKGYYHLDLDPRALETDSAAADVVDHAAVDVDVAVVDWDRKNCR